MNKDKEKSFIYLLFMA